MDKLQEAMELCKNVSDTYEDFVIGIRMDLEDYPEYIQPIIDYIKDDSSRTTSDIIGYLWDLEGRDLTPLEIVDDDEDGEWDTEPERIAG